MFEIRCRETGDYITEFDNLEEAEIVINQFAHDDMLEEMPEWKSKEWEEFIDNLDMDKYRDFYEIVESED